LPNYQAPFSTFTRAKDPLSQIDLHCTPRITKVSTNSIRLFRGTLPTFRHARITGAAFAAPQGAFEARTVKTLQSIGADIDRVAATVARYTGNVATLRMHGAEG